MASTEKLKVVVHMGEKRLLKGFYYDSNDIVSGRSIAGACPLPHHMELDRLDGKKEVIDVDQAKAIFFVREFGGQPEYRDIKFFKERPANEGLWVRVRFSDNEVTEGLVHNSVNLFLCPGFLMKPPDPSSNNRIVYALKSALVSFEVLGLRREY
jgi:hypothetical protein